jgi:hypothetical protein
MGRIFRGAVQRRLGNNRRHFSLRSLGHPSWPRSVFFQTRQPQGQKAIPPELNCRTGNFQFLGNILVQGTLGSHLDNFRAPNESQGQSPTSSPSIQLHLFFGGQNNCARSVHEPIIPS